MITFNRSDFEVIDIQRRGEPEMHINKKYITFSRSLIAEMGWPSYVRLLLNPLDGILAVQACKSSDENAYRFSRPRGEQNEAKYCSSRLIRKSVIAAMGDFWDENQFYGFRGTYFPDEKAMVFELRSGYTRNVEQFTRLRQNVSATKIITK